MSTPTTMSVEEARRIFSAVGRRTMTPAKLDACRRNGLLGGPKTAKEVQDAHDLLVRLKSDPTPKTLKAWLKVASHAYVRENWNNAFGERPEWL